MDFHIWKYSNSEGELFPLILAGWNAAFDIHCVFLVAYLIWQLLALLPEKVFLQTLNMRSTL